MWSKPVTATTASAKAKAAGVNLVLTDQNMPGMDGDNWSRHCTPAQRTKSTPILML